MSSGSAGGGVFISYRREDSQHVAGRIADHLHEHLGRAQVFMDVDSIEPGVDFVEAIERAVHSCDVLLALIGPSWATVTDELGRRRLDDPQDFVSVEIAVALRDAVRVIPILVDGASMPRPDDLPEPLVPLATRHAMRLEHVTFRTQVAQLAEVLSRILGEGPDQAERTDHDDAPSAPPVADVAPPAEPKAWRADLDKFGDEADGELQLTPAGLRWVILGPVRRREFPRPHLPEPMHPRLRELRKSRLTQRMERPLPSGWELAFEDIQDIHAWGEREVFIRGSRPGLSVFTTLRLGGSASQEEAVQQRDELLAEIQGHLPVRSEFTDDERSGEQPLEPSAPPNRQSWQAYLVLRFGRAAHGELHLDLDAATLTWTPASVASEVVPLTVPDRRVWHDPISWPLSFITSVEPDGEARVRIKDVHGERKLFEVAPLVRDPFDEADDDLDAVDDALFVDEQAQYAARTRLILALRDQLQQRR